MTVEQHAEQRPSVDPVVSVRDLRTYFHTDAGVAKAVDGVSFDVPAGRTLALVGESGCGKSVTALSILRLIPQPPGRVVSGSILLNGRDLLAAPERDLRKIRGNAVSMIFQEPMTSLNPVFRVGRQVAAVLRLHRRLSPQAARAAAVDLFARVGIPSPESRVDDYPHQMSGGMRQRVMIAMALACGPSLLIADEPTTALDVTIQAQILDLLRDLQQAEGMSMLLITHDLGVVAETAHEVAIMYAGRIVERADVRALFAEPRHPYTVGLFRSLPGVQAQEQPQAAGRPAPLYAIRGAVPAATAFPEGCRFHPRCPHAMPRCRAATPPMEPVGPNHAVACWLYDETTMRDQGRPLGLPKETRP